MLSAQSYYVDDFNSCGKAHCMLNSTAVMPQIIWTRSSGSIWGLGARKSEKDNDFRIARRLAGPRGNLQDRRSLEALAGWLDHHRCKTN